LRYPQSSVGDSQCIKISGDDHSVVVKSVTPCRQLYGHEELANDNRDGIYGSAAPPGVCEQRRGKAGDANISLSGLLIKKNTLINTLEAVYNSLR